MLSKHPLELPPGRKLSKEEIAEALRLSIIAELDAINMYLQLARAIDDEKVKKVFEDIAREEKTHVGEFLALLKQLDKEQAEELKKGEKEVEELIGLKPVNSKDTGEKNSTSNAFEEIVKREVKRTVESARALVKKLPTTKLGRGVDSVPAERAGEKLERLILPLQEISYRFRVSQRSVDYAARTGQLVEMPDAIKAALSLAAEEEKSVVESLLKEGEVKLPLGMWDEPGTSVLDVAKAVSELSKRSFRRPYVLIVSLARYAKLLAVSEKTGVTDLERVKMLVDDVVASHAISDDKALVVSATLDVFDVVYGGDSEVDYIGPENGYHAFKLWSTIGVRVRNPAGVVVMETSVK